MTNPKFAATMMAHRSYCRGQANVIDGDLAGLVDAYPDLRLVFEEVQYLRTREDELELALEIGA